MNINNIAFSLINNLKKNNQTISFAESCTGGMLSEIITRIPGASKVFTGSAICYSYRAKNKLLNIDISTLNSFGAVSEEISILMAKNAKKLFSTTFSLSVTGVAGPDYEISNKKIGTVYFSLAHPNGIENKKKHISGKSRQEIRRNASFFAIKWINLILNSI